MNGIGTTITDELQEAPRIVSRQAQELDTPIAALAARLKRQPPTVVVTCARGSSAHAATFAKHLIERRLGIPCAPAAPNIATVYRRPLQLKHQLFLSISQSGRSDDLIESAVMARAAGALTVAIVNDPTSPLAMASECVLPLVAGPERSIAATKTFVATLSALLRLTAGWHGDGILRKALERLPRRLAAAGECDWSAGLNALSKAASLITIGRGPTLAIAREAALKLKETCGIHAEAFSSAEFQHGPVSLVSPTYPVLMFMPTDVSAEGLGQLAADLRKKGATVLMTAAAQSGTISLPAVDPDHPETDAVCLVQSFYGFVVSLARHRGANADQPRHLQKITRTR